MGLQAGSLAHQIAALESGETLSRTVMLGMSQVGLHDLMKDTKRRLRNHLTKHQERAAKVSGNTYRLDCGTWTAHEDAAVFVSVAITRII